MVVEGLLITERDQQDHLAVDDTDGGAAAGEDFAQHGTQFAGSHRTGVGGGRDREVAIGQAEPGEFEARDDVGRFGIGHDQLDELLGQAALGALPIVLAGLLEGHDRGQFADQRAAFLGPVLVVAFEDQEPVRDA